MASIPLYAAMEFDEAWDGPCPQSLSEWDKFVRGTVSFESYTGVFFGEKLPNASRLDSALKKVEKCKEEWSAKQSPENKDRLQQCTSRLMTFLNTARHFSVSDEEKQKGIARSLGFNVPDQEYYKNVDDYVSIPTELTSQDFLQSISRPLVNDGYKKAKAYIDSLNKQRTKQGKEKIVAFVFPTKLGNFEISQKSEASRFFVRWPGNPIKYIQFATHDIYGGSGQTSVVAVHKDKEGTLHSYFKDHWREIPKEGRVTLRKVTEGIFTGNECISCHQSGPRQIAPRSWSKLDPETKKQIKAVNAEFAEMTGMRWGGYLDTNLLGPGLGTEREDFPRNRSFFENCSAKRYQIEAKQPSSGIPIEKLREKKDAIFKKIATAMNCGSCHDNQTRGRIGIPYDPTHTFFKIYSGEMPPENNLTEFERGILVDCLKDEYEGYLYTDEKGEGQFMPGTLARYLAEIPCYVPKEQKNGNAAKQPTH